MSLHQAGARRISVTIFLKESGKQTATFHARHCLPGFFCNFHTSSGSNYHAPNSVLNLAFSSASLKVVRHTAKRATSRCQTSLPYRGTLRDNYRASLSVLRFIVLLQITRPEAHRRGAVTTGSDKRWLPDVITTRRSLQWKHFNTLRTGDADLRFYITTVQDG